MARRVGKPHGDAIGIRIVTSDPARDLVLAVDAEVRLDQFDATPADGTLRLPAEALVRLVYGRLDDAHTPPARARLRHGDPRPPPIRVPRRLTISAPEP